MINELIEQIDALYAKAKAQDVKPDSVEIWADAWGDFDRLVAESWPQIRDSLRAIQWQPIETAPKDGTRFLVYVPLLVQPARYFGGILTGPFHRDDIPNIKWWHPLPEPPKDLP